MTQKNKNFLLIGGFIIGFILAYIFSFSKTIEVSKQLNTLKQNETFYNNISNQINTLNIKETSFNKILAAKNITGNSIQHQLLEVLTKFSEEKNIKILEFAPPHLFKDNTNGSNTTVYDFKLEGDFNSLQNVLYKLEQKYSFGNIIHVDYVKEKNYRTGKYKLTCRTLVQHVN